VNTVVNIAFILGFHSTTSDVINSSSSRFNFVVEVFIIVWSAPPTFLFTATQINLACH